MTKKDYDLIASVVVEASEIYGSAAWNPTLLINMLATALADDNPRFDRERFKLACRKVALLA